VKTAMIRSSWMAGYGYRLDCSPYLGGALEAKILLEELPLRKDKLHTLTRGIYNGPQFTRNYVESPEYGVPFMTGSNMQYADLTVLPLLSKRDAHSNKLAHLELQPGMSLISCSGTIGKMAYSRRDMAGVWSSQDILKVVSDPDKISCGYLYAYLCSKFGIPLVASGTYGAIIQHLEPEHIADLPVPRLGDTLENEIHVLVEEASELRARASELINSATKRVSALIGEEDHQWKARHESSFAFGSAKVSPVLHRLDAFHYVGYVGEGLDLLGNRYTTLYEVAECFRPNMMKRIRVEKDGIPFLGGAELQTIHQEAEEQISLITRAVQQYVVSEGTVVFQCVGQRYGIFGRPHLVNSDLAGKAVTEAVMRIIPKDPADAGYLVAYFRTEVGRRCLLAYSAGTSIPVLQEIGANQTRVLWPDEDTRQDIAKLVVEGSELRAKASRLERQSVEKTEQALVAR